MSSLLQEGQWSEGPPPAPNTRGRGSWDEVVELLKATPSSWMRFNNRARSLPDYLRGRHPGLVVEARTADNSPRGNRRRVDMWLRWPEGTET